MRAALYARVSSEGQAQRGTIASQVSLLEAKVAEVSDELVASFIDDGRSGARIDRPGLDELRDQAQAGVFERVWVLTPDRLARNFAHQMFVLDELARCGVAVCFTDAPPLEDDPQARLLVQVQGVIAEYERAKTAERQRRGKLYKVRAGEGSLRISACSPCGRRRRALGSLRARGGDRTADLRRLRGGRNVAARRHSPVVCRRHPYANGPAHVEHVHAGTAVAQCHLCRDSSVVPAREITDVLADRPPAATGSSA